MFDIQAGVAIAIFIKDANKSTPAQLYYADLWGQRDDKYRWLLHNSLIETEWMAVAPSSPFYLFVPQDTDIRAEFESNWQITEVMATNVLGFQTHRDKFAIDFDRDTIYRRISELRNTKLTDDEYRQRYILKDNRDWKLADARRYVRQDDMWDTNIINCLYRPFDTRYCYYSEVAMDYPRRELTNHVKSRDNITLLMPRQLSILGWKHVLVSQTVAESCAISTKTKEQNYVFPLYLYPEHREGELFAVEDGSAWPISDKGRRPNLNPAFVQDMADRLGLQFITEGKGDLQATFGPEDVFAYAYAVFHSPTYRARYAEFLKIDFPRLPLTSDVNLFRVLVEKGAALVGWHLMRKTGRLLTTYPESGDNIVASGYPKFEPQPASPDSPSLRSGEGLGVGITEPTEEASGRVYINKTQYFGGVPQSVWEFHVGGYQVLEKWLKDRRGRALSYEDIMHYQRVVVALHETMRLMDEIDDAIPAWPIT